METSRQALTELAVEDWTNRVAKNLLRTVCPLYKSGIHRPEPVGTGVMLRIAELVFIVTAAHVLEDLGTGDRYVGILDQFLPLPALQFKTLAPRGEGRELDRLDLACLVLDPATARRIPSADTLTFADLDAEDPAQLEPEAFHFLSGYPESRQPRRVTDDRMTANTFSQITSEVPLDEYAAINLDRKRNLFVRFNKDDSYRNFEKVIGPNLYGVSGGPIWRIGGGGTASLRRPLLSAIAISWRHRESPLGVIGTRIHEWVSFVRASFPEAAAEYDAAKSRQRTV